jgi:hypothetical protein
MYFILGVQGLIQDELLKMIKVSPEELEFVPNAINTLLGQVIIIF